MKIKIGVIGKAGRSNNLPDPLLKGAMTIGKEVAKRDCILLTGGCMGVANVAAKAASKEGGSVIGYSPGKNLKEHLEPPISYPDPVENEIPIFSGLGKVGRNVLFMTDCDGVIAVGGGIGTLNEFSIAYHEGKVIGILEGVKGLIEKISTLEKEFQKGSAKEKKAIIVKDKDPRCLVRKVEQEIKKREEGVRKEIALSFKNEKGRQLSGIAHIPSEEKPPVVVICQGFQGTKTQKKYIKLARELQKNGMLAFRFDFEGCGDSEGDPQEITVKEEIDDLRKALATVAKECHVDLQRVAFVGDSLGAVVAGSCAKELSVKTLVFWSPAFIQKELFLKWHTKEELKEIKERGVVYKKEKEIGKKYYLENKNKDYSCLLSNLSVPVLIVHGSEDKDVPLEHSEKLAEKHKKIAFRKIKGGNHKMDDVFSQKKLTQITTDWLRKNL